MDQLPRAEQLKQTRSYWKRHIESWQETGLTQTEYCRQHDLKLHQMVYWKKRFSKAEEGISFVPLKLEDLVDVPVHPDRAALCLEINSHFKIEIRPGFDAKLLRQLIFALRGLS